MATDPITGMDFGASLMQMQQAKQALAANNAAPSVGRPLAPAAPPSGVSTNAMGAGGKDASAAYNPAQGQLHSGTPAGGPATSIVNPATGQIMSMPGRDNAGNLTIRPGEQGFQTSMQRVDLDPYAQQLGAAGNQLMQRGMSGATLAGMPQVEADKMRAAQINRSGFDQQAIQQNALARQGNAAIGQLQGAAAGQAPSAALIQQQQGIEAAQRAQMAMAASARGGADQRAAAMRQGQMAGSEMAMQGIEQASALRAQEMAQARGQLVGAIGQQQQLAQGQGMNQAAIAQAQAGLTQQAGLANQGTGLQAQMANQQGYLGASGQDAGLAGLGAGLYQQGAGLGLAGVQFNNQQAQTDFNQQMQMLDAQNATYGIQQGVAAQRYAADQQQDAAVTGALINAGGQLVGAGMQAFAPQQPRRY